MWSISIHPSIISTAYPLSGCRGAGANPSWHWERGGVHPGQVASPSLGWHIERNNHSHIHTYGHVRVSSSPACVWTVGGSQRHTEKNHTQSPHRKAPACIVMAQTTCNSHLSLIWIKQDGNKQPLIHNKNDLHAGKISFLSMQKFLRLFFFSVLCD